MITDAEIAGIMGWRGPGAYTAAAMRNVRRCVDLAASNALAAPVDLPDAVIDATAEAIGDAYDCMRVWAAWGIGTMSQNDFVSVADDGGRVAEIALAAITAWLSTRAATQPSASAPERIEAMQARIAELEAEIKCAYATADRNLQQKNEAVERADGLELVQGGLVVALEHYANGDSLSGHTARAALAAAQTPAMRKVYLVPRDDGSMEQLDSRPHGCGSDDCTVAYVPVQQQSEGGA